MLFRIIDRKTRKCYASFKTKEGAELALITNNLQKIAIIEYENRNAKRDTKTEEEKQRALPATKRRRTPHCPRCHTSFDDRYPHGMDYL